MNKNRIRLNICGAECTITSEDSENYVLSLGNEVEESIKDIMDKNDRVSLTLAAILAALNFCDESHKSVATADNLRSQIKDYLEDSSHARMDAVESHRELERVRRENQTLRARLAAVGGENAPAKQEAVPAPAGVPAPAAEKPVPSNENPKETAKTEEKEKAEQDSFMSFFEKKADEQ